MRLILNVLIVAPALLLASCSQNREEERAAAVVAAEKAAQPELQQIRIEEFCENNTLKTRGIFSSDGGKTTIPMGVKIVEPRRRC